MFFKIVALKNFANFTGKHLYRSLFLNKVAGFRNSNFIKKTPTQVFSSAVAEIFKNTFFYRTSSVAASHSFKSPACNFIKNVTPAKMFFENFATFLRISLDRTPPDDCFSCLFVNFEKFYRGDFL